MKKVGRYTIKKFNYRFSINWALKSIDSKSIFFTTLLLLTTSLQHNLFAVNFYANNKYENLELQSRASGISKEQLHLFLEQTEIALTGVDNSCMALGDFNNDGKIDIIYSGKIATNENITKIYINNGNNTFSELLSTGIENVSNGSIALGDYNNDGFLDILITGHNGSTQISKIYRNNGNNSFTEQTNIPLLGVSNGSAAWGDYNNDGNIDILLSGFSSIGLVTLIYKNNGDGTFTKDSNIEIMGVENSAVAWVDYNNDGYLDFIVTGQSYSGPIALIYRNNGNGTFSPQSEIHITGIRYGSVDWADYNNDGFLDILITGQTLTARATKVYKNNGNETFTEQTSIALPEISNSNASWGDYNNDGLIDFIVTGISNAGIISKIYKNNGNNSFTEESNPPLLSVRNGTVNWFDFDNDGDLDIVITGTTSSSTKIAKIFRNETNSSNTTPASPTPLNSQISNTRVQLNWDHATDTETPSNGLSYNVRVGTTPGGSNIVNPNSSNTGKRKVAAFGNAQSNTLLILENLPKGSYYWSVQSIDNAFEGSPFSEENLFQVNNEVQSSEITLVHSYGISQTIQWKRGNGSKCVVFMCEGENEPLTPSYGSTYTANQTFGLGSSGNNWYCVYNGSGSETTIVNLKPFTKYTLQIYEYTGSAGSENYFYSSAQGNPFAFKTSPFVEQANINLPQTYFSSAAWGDYNNDGLIDFVQTGTNQTYSRIYKNNGNGTFTEQTSITLPGVTSGAVAWADYNNNGLLDLIVTGSDNSGNPIAILYQNNGDNSFTSKPSIGFTGVRNGSVAWGDYDNDGDLDLLITGTSSLGRIAKVYRNNGNGTFNELSTANLAKVSNSAAAWADFNNNGFLDIIITGKDEANKPITKLYINNGNSTFTEQINLNIPGVFSGSIALGDYNNNGFTDILISGATVSSFDLGNPSNPITKIFRNNGNGTFTELASAQLKGIYKSSMAWVDFDNDGLIDISISGISETGIVSKIYRNNGNETFTEQTNISLKNISDGSLLWADYDKDGRADVYITGYNGSTGVAKIFKNFTTAQNTAPSPPEGLTHAIDARSINLNWLPSNDDLTPSSGLTYNVRVGKTPQGSQILSPMSLASGERTIIKSGNAGSNTSKSINNILPGVYYWSVQSIDNNLVGSSFSPEKTITIDSIQARGLTAYIESNTSLFLKWKRGNGQRCAVFCKIGPSSGAIPINNQTYIPDNIFGIGDQIGSTGWYCIYNGIADSTYLLGLIPGYTYTIHVVEYIGNAGNEKYYTELRNDNIGIFATSNFTEEVDISIVGASQGSVEWGDYNNDGFLDILISGNSNMGNITRIYKNNGNNSFTEQSSISLVGVGSGSAIWGDYNNDGWLDILLSGNTTGDNKVSLIYINNGNNTFTKQNDIILQGTVSSSLAWADYNNDSNIDIVLAGIGEGYLPITKVYMNNGDMSFAEQTENGILNTAGGKAIWGDYNNDGYIDLLISGLPTTRLFKNNKDNTFTWQTNSWFSNEEKCSSDWGDFDNDGYLDLVITGEQNTFVYRNNGNGTFTKLTNTPLAGMGESYASWGDYNNDGYLDIALSGKTENGFVTKIYRNNKNNTFSELTGLNIIGVRNGHISWGDYDNDGDLDLLINGLSANGNVTKLYRNNSIMKAGSHQPNNKPKAPTGLNHTLTPNEVQLMWHSVITDETPYKSMSYNVRIKEKGSDTWLASPMASNDGSRRVSAMGNSQLRTNYTFKNLKSNTYYWQVQAVDHGYLGGEWSEIDSFEVKNTLAFFVADTVCFGLPTQFTDKSTATDGIEIWEWDFGDGNTSTTQNPTHIFTSSGAYIVKLIITSTIGDKDSIEVNVIVKPTPHADFFASTACQGSETVISNLSNTNSLSIVNWNWNFGDGRSSNLEEPNSHGYLNAGNYQVTLKVTAENGCTSEMQKTVSVGSYPIATISANASLSFCKGDSVGLSVPYNTLYSYAWLESGVAILNSDSSVFVAKTTGSYSVEIVNSIGECKSTSINVPIVAYEIPETPHIVARGPTEFCQGDSVTLSVSFDESITYQWKLNGGAFGLNRNSIVAKSSGEYSVTAVNTSGCAVKSTNKIIVTVNPKPTISGVSINGPTTFCSGGNVQLSVAYNSTNSYQWYNNNYIINNNTNTLNAVTSGNYWLQVSNSFGCTSSTVPIEVIVNPSPIVPTIEQPSTTTLCSGDSVLLNVYYPISDVYFQWKLNGVNYGSNSHQTFAKPSGTYNLIITNEYNCSSSSSNNIAISVNSNPSLPSVSYGNTEFCQGGSVTFFVTNNPMYTYQWHNTDGPIQGAITNQFTTSKQGSYWLQAFNSYGCNISTTAVDVTVHSNPTTPIIVEENNITSFCPGTLLSLRITNSSQYYVYQWIRSGNILQGENSLSLSGTLESGSYSVIASTEHCTSESIKLNLLAKPAPPKPEIYARGPNVWLLACSNETAVGYRWFYNNNLIPGANTHLYVANQNLGNYFVEVNEGGECWTATDVINIPTGTIVGIDINTNTNELRVFPNPSSGVFKFDFKEALIGKISVKVFDIYGNRVATEEYFNTENFTLDISQLPIGLYICTIENNGVISTKKLVKN
jgi:PKD repeat protein